MTHPHCCYSSPVFACDFHIIPIMDFLVHHCNTTSIVFARNPRRAPTHIIPPFFANRSKVFAFQNVLCSWTSLSNKCKLIHREQESEPSAYSSPLCPGITPPTSFEESANAEGSRQRRSPTPRARVAPVTSVPWRQVCRKWDRTQDGGACAVATPTSSCKLMSSNWSWLS